jgi:hypothetical protein
VKDVDVSGTVSDPELIGCTLIPALLKIELGTNPLNRTFAILIV